ncbi:hypothetical protein EDF87_10883 [Pseudomonas helmanticensis]|uniref:Uncharacterized protein n=1 Tax=Pseudomonas helmanticensis TaxID=1471381 RepID=A0A4R7VA71_9PSED|nr:hypothetical protein EDF87_10883 [Pseudomonas helmanticensis]
MRAFFVAMISSRLLMALSLASQLPQWAVAF